MPDTRKPDSRHFPGPLPSAILAVLAGLLLFAACGQDADQAAPAAPEAAAPARADAPAADPGRFVVALVTGSDSQGSDVLQAVKAVQERYGRAEEGGIIRHAFYPARFIAEMDQTIELIDSLADDPLTKVIIVCEGVPGTAEAFARIKARRPEMILMAAETHDDPALISPNADLVVNSDFIARGYLLAWAAKQMGAETVVHMSFPRHMIDEASWRRRAIMEVAAGDLGLGFVFVNAPDPTGDEGIEGSRQFVRTAVPNLLAEHGPNTAFFSTSNAHVLPLIESVAEHGGYFLESEVPSPLQGYPEALGLDVSDFDGGWDALVAKIEAGLEARGASGRMGAWPVSLLYAHVTALVDLGVGMAKGEVAPAAAAGRIAGMYSAIQPGLDWRAAPYVDPAMSPLSNVIMVLADTRLLGKGPLGAAAVEVPARYKAVGLVDGRPAAPPYHIAVITGDGVQGTEDVIGAEDLIRRHGDARSGGIIRHLQYPDSYLDHPGLMTELVVSVADDPLLKVVVVNQAITGTAEAFRRIKAARPDVFCLSGEPHEDTAVIAGAADLVLASDFISRGYLIPYAAKLLGAEKLVHISFDRHLAYESMGLRLKIMEEACKDLGLGFAKETAPDPVEGYEKALAFIFDSYPGWLERHGRETAFFATNDGHTEPLLRQMASLGGYFVEADIPSTLLGYPGAFDLDLAPHMGQWKKIQDIVETAVVEAGGSGRMGAWIYPLGYVQSAGLGEFGNRLAEGSATLTDTNVLLECLEIFTPGARWNGSYLNDLVTGKPMREYFLIYQDVYVFGRGFIETTRVEIPDKFYFIKP